MTLVRRYLTGVAVVGALGVSLAVLAPAADRSAVWWGVGVALLLQTPLGWWAVHSIGTDRFMAIWGLGMLVRFALVVVAGMVVLPVLGRRAGAMLGSMVGVLVALLLVEGFTALRAHSREDEQ